MGNYYWLSLLIPSYEHPLGVLRILDTLYASNFEGIQCIVSDDSLTDAVQITVLNHPLYKDDKIQYYRNSPSLGAVKNWNSLIARAVGDYYLIMHHDECPERIDFFAKLFNQIYSNDIDILILECLIPTLANSRLRPHVPRWLQWLFMKSGPSHLLRHNTLGSPSVIVARRNVYLAFNEELKWLVDVEWMVRLLKQVGVNYCFASDLAIVSIVNKETSITNKLSPNISLLEKYEINFISKYLGHLFVFKILAPNGCAFNILAKIEWSVWYGLRIATKGSSWLYSRKMPRRLCIK